MGISALRKENPRLLRKECLQNYSLSQYTNLAIVLTCLFFLDLPLLITPMVPSKFSSNKNIIFKRHFVVLMLKTDH